MDGEDKTTNLHSSSPLPTLSLFPAHIYPFCFFLAIPVPVPTPRQTGDDRGGEESNHIEHKERKNQQERADGSSLPVHTLHITHDTLLLDVHTSTRLHV
jgi:hypothetical protein